MHLFISIYSFWYTHLILRFGERSDDLQNYTQMLNHKVHDCEVCLAENQKLLSKIDLDITESKLMEKQILPKNECWICNIAFKDTDDHLEHFSKVHECDFCGVGFDDTQSKVFYEIDYHCPFCKEYFQNTNDKDCHQINCTEKMI